MTNQKQLEISIINALSYALELRDPYTAYHEVNVSYLALHIGKELGISKDQLECLELASRVHDIGKMAVPLEILIKPGKISLDEYTLVKGHCKAGYDVLSRIEWQYPIADVVYQHHEKLDGSGYPRGLKDHEILLESKILTVSDIAESMASHRPYRPTMGLDLTIAELQKLKGTKLHSDSCEIAINWLVKNYRS